MVWYDIGPGAWIAMTEGQTVADGDAPPVSAPGAGPSARFRGRTLPPQIRALSLAGEAREGPPLLA